ncbi:GGDEF domain-containing protein [Maridesulfovibrio sp. FT414]|uniref:GGDEF domain-containing protein n=1 Tax=Maridesulfovibrio sp. FT414 TaxID=2979469 RepID=UPI003D80930C
MRHRDANKLRYRITLPLIIVLSLAAVYFFHTIIIEHRNYNDLRSRLSEIQLTAYEILNDKTGTGYDLHRLRTLVEELQNYPESGRFYRALNNESTALLPSAEAFMDATGADNNSALPGTLDNLDRALRSVLDEIRNDFKPEAANQIKIEYGLLFMISLMVLIHYIFINYPMRQELARNVRENETCNSTIRKLAERDTLTNLPGRMKFYEDSEREIAAATRYGSDLTLIKMDIHNFKEINRQHGQKAGDKLLAGFARTVRKHLRRPDSFFRVGGDKFIILAPHTNMKNAQNLAEKIGKLIDSDKTLKVIPFNVNTGIATCSPDDTAESLLKKVDLALTESKKYGAGAVYTHPEPPKED